MISYEIHRCLELNNFSKGTRPSKQFHEPLHLCIQGEEKAELDFDEIINRGLLNQYEVFPSKLQFHKCKSIN